MPESKIIANLAERYEFTDPYLAHDVKSLERRLREALDEIHCRLEAVLADLDSEDIRLNTWAIFRIADSAGASGPIGSQWEKAVATAAKLYTLMELSLRPTKDGDR